MLADGLFGLRKDFGAFSRTKGEYVQWSRRREQLLHEVLQYDPDIITLQECDHYYDCFLPELSARGYNGMFAPKPASACLEVSDSSDGCAIFVKTSKLRITSSETITFALSRAEVSDGDEELVVEDKQVRAQNQVALLLVCELIQPQQQNSGSVGGKKSIAISSTATLTTSSNSANTSTQIFTQNNKISENLNAPPIIVATTHLKAAKTLKGERYRYREVVQLLAAIKRVRDSMGPGRQPAILLTGDLNAAPTNSSTGYSSLAYEAVKSHSLGLRSVLNDDVRISNNDIPVWTTWKARRKQGEESVTKHCIDYILYAPPPSLGTSFLPLSPSSPSTSSSASPPTASSTTFPIALAVPPAASTTTTEAFQVGLRATAVLDLFTAQEVGDTLLPSPSYPSDHLAIAVDLEVLSVFEK
jgi:endonuclease/exonuclease/phosphatase family metal-dependent hydrolase